MRHSATSPQAVDLQVVFSNDPELGSLFHLHGHWIYTMLRCVFALCLSALLSLPAFAQRVFDANALRGELVLQEGQNALLNGKPAQLSPGARIRNEQNLLQLTGQIMGKKFLVHYTINTVGQIHNVWILTADEATKRPWPATPEQAAAWVFDPTMQAWSKP
jgi:hypothetical protein